MHMNLEEMEPGSIYGMENEHISKLLPELERVDLWLQLKLLEQHELDGNHDLEQLLFTSQELNARIQQPKGAPRWAQREHTAKAQSWKNTNLSENQAASGSRLDALVERFDLSLLEREVLLLCLLLRFEPTYSLIFSFMQKDENKHWPSANLLLQLLCDSPLECAQQRKYLLSQGRLLRHSLLVAVDNKGRPVEFSEDTGLQLEQIVFQYLIGDEVLPELLKQCGRWLKPPTYRDLHGSFTQAIGKICFRANKQRNAPLVFLRGASGSGRMATVARAAESVQQHAFYIDLEQLPQEEDIAWDTLMAALRETHLQGGWLVLRSLSVLDEKFPHFIVALAHRFAEHYGPIVCLSEPEAPLLWFEGRTQLVLEMPERSLVDEVGLIQERINGLPTEPDLALEALVRRFRVSPDTLDYVLEEANLYREQRAPDSLLSQGDLVDALRLRAQQNFGKLAQRTEPCRNFEDLVLNDDLQLQMREILAAIQHREAVLKRGFGRKIGYGTGISALFYGDSGSGKSMAAEVLAGELGVDLIKIDLSTVVNKYIGETEKNLSKIFDLASADAGVLFFDEADALFGKRSEVKDAHDRHANIEVSYLLQRLERYPGLVVLASNNRSHLDSAFCRRLTFMLHFSFPDVAIRERIWRTIWPQQIALSSAINFSELARCVELTGGSIRNVALLSSWLAASEGAPQIECVHVERALRRELAKTGRMIPNILSAQ